MHISSIEFIENLEFDSFETYSFQRGNDYETMVKVGMAEYQKLKVRHEKGKLLTTEERMRFLELYELFGKQQYLRNAKGEFHPSSRGIAQAKRGDILSNRLVEILRTPNIDTPAWMCGPIYRDAIVFRDENGKIISELNVCLNCEFMLVNRTINLDADKSTYHNLRQFFIDCGHKIEPLENY